jgi:hypothetical protein
VGAGRHEQVCRIGKVRLGLSQRGGTSRGWAWGGAVRRAGRGRRGLERREGPGGFGLSRGTDRHRPGRLGSSRRIEMAELGTSRWLGVVWIVARVGRGVVGSGQSYWRGSTLAGTARRAGGAWFGRDSRVGLGRVGTGWIGAAWLVASGRNGGARSVAWGVGLARFGWVRRAGGADRARHLGR